MSEKLLVADDSPTIQKVVGITLANSDYELVQAQSEDELMEKINSDQFDLLLLDFNLSETLDGYDLCKKIRVASPHQKIMIMLGTFDTVEDHRLEELGVVERVIKPFESSKFIKKVKEAIAQEEEVDGFANDSFVDLEENNPFEEGSSFETSDDSDSENDGEEDLENDWTISGPQVEEGDEPMPEGNFLEEASMGSSNELVSEVQGWGMSVPGVIGDDKQQTPVMPSAIETSSDDVVFETLSNEDATGEWDTASLMKEDDSAMPAENDLDYPDLGSSDSDQSPSSSLVSLDELAGNIDEDDEDLDETDPQIIIEKQEDSPDLIKELGSDPDDFWAADDSYDPDQSASDDGIKIGPEDPLEDSSIEQHTPIEVGPKLEEDESHNPTVEALNDLRDREEEFNVDSSTSSSSVNSEEIINALKAEFKPLLKEMVREVIEEMGRETSERIAWEIIPDLAENLIRTEVEKLSKKVQDKHSLS